MEENLKETEYTVFLGMNNGVDSIFKVKKTGSSDFQSFSFAEAFEIGL